MTKISTGIDAIAQKVIEHHTPDARPMVPRLGRV